MLDKLKTASECYKKGCTCSQAVLCAYADELGIKKETIYRMMEGFGCGMGKMQELCSALTAAICVIGFYASRGIPQEKYGRDNASCGRPEVYERVAQVMEIFRREYGSVVCREVLCGAKPQPFKCGAKVKPAAEIVEKMMGKEDDIYGIVQEAR